MILIQYNLSILLFEFDFEIFATRFVKGPEEARLFPNSSMIGIGITMEGINQNEFIYEFMLEKAWRFTLSEDEINDFARNFSNRRYFSSSNVSLLNSKFEKVWIKIIVTIFNNFTVLDFVFIFVYYKIKLNFNKKVLYNIDDYQNKQLFTKRPSFYLQPEVSRYFFFLNYFYIHLD